MEKAWIQAAVDVDDIDLGIRIARMALEHGAEWVEVGTPLLMRYGFSAIGMMRKALGKDAVLIADYKFPVSRACAQQAAEQGANYVLLSTVYHDFIRNDNVMFSRKYGIEPIFFLACSPYDFEDEAKKLEACGAKYLFTHRYAEIEVDGQKQRRDSLALLRGACSCKIGITSDDLSETVDTVRAGADWMTFGVALKTADAAACKTWVDAIHGAR